MSVDNIKIYPSVSQLLVYDENVLFKVSLALNPTYGTMSSTLSFRWHITFGDCFSSFTLKEFGYNTSPAKVSPQVQQNRFHAKNKTVQIKKCLTHVIIVFRLLLHDGNSHFISEIDVWLYLANTFGVSTLKSLGLPYMESTLRRHFLTEYRITGIIFTEKHIILCWCIAHLFIAKLESEKP